MRSEKYIVTGNAKRNRGFPNWICLYSNRKSFTVLNKVECLFYSNENNCYVW